MNKKISIGIVAILMIAGAVVYGNSNTNTNCPNKPGCICSKEANVQIVKKQGIAKEKGNCPNTPSCICN